MSALNREQIVFIGTSNSLMVDGYTVPLKERYRDHANYALGASAYTILALQAERIRQHRGATIIIDLAVTDLYIGDVVQIDPVLHRRAFEALLGDCAVSGSRPYILVMPSAWTRAYDGPVRALYHRYAQDYQIPIFDGFTFVERLYAVRPDLARYGYEPGTHLNAYLARMLGRCLDTAIESFVSKSVVRFVQRDNPWQAASFQPLGLQNDSRTVEYVNSLGSRQVVKLKPGESAQFRLPEHSEVIGYSVNAMSSWGHLRVSGNRTITKDLRNGWTKEGERLILTAWTFAQPVQPVQNIVNVQCLQPAEVAGVVEPSDIPFRGKVIPPIDQIELCALLALLPHGPQTRVAYDGPLDLLSLVSDAELEASSYVEPEPPFVSRPDPVRVGEDGVAVTIPRGYSYRQGRDGRIVPIAPGSVARMDENGRMFVVTPAQLKEEAEERERARLEREEKRAQHRLRVEQNEARRREVEDKRAAARDDHRARLAQAAIRSPHGRVPSEEAPEPSPDQG